MRIYLSGPMRGMPDENHKFFASAAHCLRLQGHEVFNPAEESAKLHCTDHLSEMDVLRCVFRHDTEWICTRAEAVAILPGWECSRGATAERALALAIGIPVYYLQLQHSGVNWALNPERPMGTHEFLQDYLDKIA